jgi:hypothetical protein
MVQFVKIKRGVKTREISEKSSAYFYGYCLWQHIDIDLYVYMACHLFAPEWAISRRAC